MSDAINTTAVLNRLKKHEAEWMRTGRWYHLIVGILVCAGQLGLYFSERRLMLLLSGLFKGRSFEEVTDTIYVMGAAGVAHAVLLLYGLYSLRMAWLYWNGNDFRRGLIACLDYLGNDGRRV